MRQHQSRKDDFNAIVPDRGIRLRSYRAGRYHMLWFQPGKCRLRRPRKLLRKGLELNTFILKSSL
jgi:hypothetical protein